MRDELGAPISGVILDESRTGAPGELPARASDSFGRIFRFLGYRETFTARLEKAGYAPQVITGDCPPGGKTVRDMTIVLSKAALR
ncbi:MAG: hypothetical protein ABSC93_02090 [Bryobacteraceae bacterium]|jgi:hypothetical protein